MYPEEREVQMLPGEAQVAHPDQQKLQVYVIKLLAVDEETYNPDVHMEQEPS